MALILLRHARPLGGEGLCYGATDLPPGPDLVEVAERLSTSLPPFTRIVTSPLTRAARLATALAKSRDLAVILDARLTEMDFGAWEGVAWDAIPRTELDAWAKDLLHARPHGGESVAMLAERVGAALSDWEAEGALVVTHMGVIRAALARAGRDGAWQAKLGFGEALVL